MQPARIPLRLIPGASSNQAMLLMQERWVYKAIESIQAEAPVRLTVPEHGLTYDWPVWIHDVRNLPALNRQAGKAWPHIARLIDENTLEISDFDAAGTRATGGRLVYHPPIELESVVATLTITGCKEDDEPIVLDSMAGGLVIEGPGRIRRIIEADAVIPERGHYEMTLRFPAGAVYRIAEGPMTTDITDSQDPGPMVIAFAVQGPPGEGGAVLSADPDNALRRGTDGGLYVAASGEISIDLLPYYESARDGEPIPSPAEDDTDLLDAYLSNRGTEL
jgi:hypothetical protein